MTELLDQSLAAIVTKNYKTAAILEKYQLDFCCKGNRSLQQACRERKINPVPVLTELAVKYDEESEAQADLCNMTLQELITYILLTHHRYVRENLPVICGYIKKVSSKHGERHPELRTIEIIFNEVSIDLEEHMLKEENLLFPRIIEVESQHREKGLIPVSSNYLNVPVSVMENEHDHAGAMLQDIRSLTDNFQAPPDACTTYRLCYDTLRAFEEDLHRHIHLENNILFKRVLDFF